MSSRSQLPSGDQMRSALLRLVRIRERAVAMTALFARSGQPGLSKRIREAATTAEDCLALGLRSGYPQSVSLLRSCVQSLTKLEADILMAARLNLISMPENTDVMSEIRALKRTLADVASDLLPED